MTRFKYKAISDSGNLIQDEIEAASLEEVAKDLNSRGYTPVDISEKMALPDFSGFLSFFSSFRSPKVKPRELMIFFRQLAALFTAGVPLFESLLVLEEQFVKGGFKEIVPKIKEQVAGGATFSEALAKYPKVFSNVIVAMIGAGERAGALEAVLKRISAYLEEESQLQKKVQSALRYPLIVVIFLTVAFMAAVLFIIPKFAPVFQTFKAGLPLPTRILLGINYTIINYWWLILAVLAIFYVSLKLYRSTSRGRRFWDQLLLKVPVFGMLLRKISLARFFSMLSAMLSSGISIVQGLEITANTAGNAVIEEAILKIREKVVGGVALSESMKEYDVFPSTSIHLVAIGEKSGTLDDMLVKTADYFTEEADYTISNLMSLLEPFLVVFLGLMVLLLAMGIFLPMWSMMQLYTH